ncbi:myo-inositol-2-dehydrogenase [Legionella waltersii]|uniref:Myo-inositol-2-dehydrogenase n=2 Tax=Legionella waltersii TaxID=66969 RepID=A0A0W1A181_9GAMM|nr:myo-inositol-2-dehydrogenase [Legionella waltersii]SNV04853.1 myo-inositol 2-dehydrogenase [Legionella waltersii]
MNKRCRIGILGAGRIGKIHAENVKYHIPNCELVALADPNLDFQWAENLGIALMTHHSEEVINHPNIDAIIIASPSTQHIQHINDSIKAGKSVFCEKPIGINEEEIVSTLQAVRDSNTLLQIGFNRRFDPSFSNLRLRLKGGEIGSPQLIRITSRDPRCPSTEYIATSGGLFLDMTIHDFDMARYLAQSEVVEVYAMGAVLINPEFENLNDIDTAIIQLRFMNGTMATIDNSRQAVYGYDQRIEVFGSEGMLQANNIHEHSVSCLNANNSYSAKPQYFFLERYQQAFVEEIKAFCEAWKNSLPSPVSGNDALQALRIANAANQSLKTKLPVVLS